MITNEWELKKQIIDIGKRLWMRGYVAANDGNITVKINDEEILATPTGVSKGFMTNEMIIKLNIYKDNPQKKYNYKPSSEIKMHLEVYRERKDIQAVIHAHPPYCTSFAVAGIPLNKCIIPEAIVSLGAVSIAPYGTPSTEEVPQSIKSLIKKSDVLLLANHGALTIGADLKNAYFKMETLEHSSQIIFQAMQLGKVNMLQEEEVKKLMEVREKMNIQGKIMQCEYNSTAKKGDFDDKLIQNIADEVLKRLRNSENK